MSNYWFKEDDKVFLLVYIQYSPTEGWWGFVDLCNPTNKARYVAFEQKLSLSIAKTDGKNVIRSKSLAYALRKCNVINRNDKGLIMRIWHLSMWPVWLAGVLFLIAVNASVPVVIALGFLWLGVMVFLSDILTKYVVTGDSQ